MGYIQGNHELGFYKNSRKSVESFSVYYSLNKSLFISKKIDAGVKIGGSLYDNSGLYDYKLMPIAAGFVDYKLSSKVKLRANGTYNLLGLQVLISGY